MTNYDTRWVSLSTESSYGGGATGSVRYCEADDESFNGRYDLVDRSDMTYYAQSKSKIGKEYSDGSVNWAMQADDWLGQILLALFGTDTEAPDKTHTFTEAGTLPSHTLVVQRETKRHTFTGMVLDRFSVGASLNEYVMCSADFVGKAESAIVGSGSGATFSTLDAAHFTGVTVQFEDSAASTLVKSVSMEWSLNRDTDNSCGLGNSTYIRAPAHQRRELSGTIEFNQAIYSTSVNEPDYDNLVVTNDIIPGSTSAVTDGDIVATFSDGTNSLAVTAYKVVYETPETSVSGRDAQTMSVSFKGLYDGTANALSRAVLVNQQATAYS